VNTIPISSTRYTAGDPSDPATLGFSRVIVPSALGNVASTVARALGFTSWSIIGHSLGGHLALTLAAREPERTASVTAISTTGPGALAVLRHPIRRFATLPWLAGMLGAMRFLAALGPAGGAFIRTLHQLALVGRLSTPLFSQPKSLDDSVFDSLASEIRPQAFVRAAEAASRYDERAWSSIRCPVTIVRGRRDVFVSPNDDAWFAAALPHAKQRVAVRAGHFAHIERAGHGSRPRPAELMTAEAGVGQTCSNAQESERKSFSSSSC